MRITSLASFALASSLVLAGSAATALAQQSQPAQDAPKEHAKDHQKDSDKAQTASGELVKVDTEKKTLAVRMADGAEWSFDYTTATEISGGSKGEQGLATAEGSKVVVHYKTEEGKKTATKVVVTPAAEKK